MAENSTDATAATSASVVPTAPTGQLAAASASFKMPPFWKGNVTLWFLKVETHFDLCRITSQKSRFQHVLADLDESVMLEVADVLSSPTAGSEYDTLKQTMIDRFGESNENRIRRVLDGLELGDRTPSALLRLMRTTAGTNINETTLKTLWRSRLPDRVSEIISAHDAAGTSISLDTLAKIADSIHSSSRPSRIDAVSQDNDIFASLSAQISELTQRLSRMEQKPRRYRDNSRNRSPSRPRLYDGLCYFHKKFGSAARKCATGCRMAHAASNSNSGN